MDICSTPRIKNQKLNFIAKDFVVKIKRYARALSLNENIKIASVMNFYDIWELINR